MSELVGLYFQNTRLPLLGPNCVFFSYRTTNVVQDSVTFEEQQKKKKTYIWSNGKYIIRVQWSPTISGVFTYRWWVWNINSAIGEGSLYFIYTNVYKVKTKALARNKCIFESLHIYSKNFTSIFCVFMPLSVTLKKHWLHVDFRILICLMVSQICWETMWKIRYPRTPPDKNNNRKFLLDEIILC